jgi:hypothetical protein
VACCSFGVGYERAVVSSLGVGEGSVRSADVGGLTEPLGVDHDDARFVDLGHVE